MRRVKTNRKLFTGAAVVAVPATLGVVQGMLDKAAAQAKQVPRFEVDPGLAQTDAETARFRTDDRSRHFGR